MTRPSPLLVEPIGGGAGLLTVRAAEPDDIDGVMQLYRELSVTDRYSRFFTGAMPAESIVETWIRAAEHGGYALVVEVSALGDDAVDGVANHIVAEAGFMKLSDGDGEFAITVAEDWRGWLGPYLLDAVLRAAAERGVSNLQAEVLSKNQAMIRLARSRGCAVMDNGDWSTIRLTMASDGAVPSGPGHHDRPRIQIEGQGSHWRGADAAIEAGCDVMVCTGPESRFVRACPVLAGEECPLARDADVIVCALPGDEHGDELVEAHERIHPEVPVEVMRGGEGSPEAVVRRVAARFEGDAGAS